MISILRYDVAQLATARERQICMKSDCPGIYSEMQDACDNCQLREAFARQVLLAARLLAACCEAKETHYRHHVALGKALDADKTKAGC